MFKLGNMVFAKNGAGKNCTTSILGVCGGVLVLKFSVWVGIGDLGLQLGV